MEKKAKCGVMRDMRPSPGKANGSPGMIQRHLHPALLKWPKIIRPDISKLRVSKLRPPSTRRGMRYYRAGLCMYVCTYIPDGSEIWGKLCLDAGGLIRAT